MFIYLIFDCPKRKLKLTGMEIILSNLSIKVTSTNENHEMECFCYSTCAPITTKFSKRNKQHFINQIRMLCRNFPTPQRNINYVFSAKFQRKVAKI